MPTLAEKREELAAKSKDLHEIFAEAGDSVDLAKVTKITGSTAEKATEIKRRNDELTAIGKEVEVFQARDNQAQLEKYLSEPQGVTFPGRKSAPKDENPFTDKTLGDIFIESDAYKMFNRGAGAGPAVEIDLKGSRNGGVDMKALLDTTGYAVESVRTGGIRPSALRRPTVGDLFATGTTRAAAIKFMEETTTTNAVATVAEGAAKPESTLAFTERTAPVRKIAGVLPVTDELIEDEPAMRSYIEQRLRLFLALTEENQLLNGTGVAPQITGVTVATGVQTQAKGTDPTPDAFYKAMTLIRTNAFLEPSAVVVHPLDWQDIALLRTADGIYIWGAPYNSGPERLWGLSVTITTAATQNTGVVGAFDTAAQIFRRNEVSFAISSEHASFFTENKLMLRVEERLALAIYRPSGFCTVTGI